jgi:hypothetical protein
LLASCFVFVSPRSATRHATFHFKTYRLVLLDVQPDRSSRTAGAGQTHHDPTAVRKLDVQSLVLCHAAVNGVLVLEVASIGDRKAIDGAADEGAVGDLGRQVTRELLGAIGVDILIVVTGEEGA